jgi:uncharacterized protein (DUF433 family)
MVSGNEDEMATATVDIGTIITRSPEIRGDRPRIAGTGVTVQRIVGLYKLGLTPEEIAVEFGHLSLAQVYAALAYYHANRAEIEAAIAKDEAAGDSAETAWHRSRLAAA